MEEWFACDWPNDREMRTQEAESTQIAEERGTAVINATANPEITAPGSGFIA